MLEEVNFCNSFISVANITNKSKIPILFKFLQLPISFTFDMIICLSGDDLLNNSFYLFFLLIQVYVLFFQEDMLFVCFLIQSSFEDFHKLPENSSLLRNLVFLSFRLTIQFSKERPTQSLSLFLKLGLSFVFLLWKRKSLLLFLFRV